MGFNEGQDSSQLPGIPTCVPSDKENYAEIGKNVAWVSDFYEKSIIIPKCCEPFSMKAEEW